MQKRVYTYEYLNNWKKFSNTSVPDKENFFSHLNMEGLTGADYTHAKRVFKDFRIKNFGEYHELYVQSYTLLLVDVFRNFLNISLEIYELDPACFLTASGLKLKLELWSVFNMLIIAEKGIRGGIYNTTLRYAKVNNKYMKDFD